MLYALVAAGFVSVVVVLVIGSAVAGLTPTWWTVVMSVALLGFGLWGIANWRKTASLLIGSIGLFVLWTVVTLIVV